MTSATRACGGSPALAREPISTLCPPAAQLDFYGTTKAKVHLSVRDRLKAVENGAWG